MNGSRGSIALTGRSGPIGSIPGRRQGSSSRSGGPLIPAPAAADIWQEVFVGPPPPSSSSCFQSKVPSPFFLLLPSSFFQSESNKSLPPRNLPSFLLLYLLLQHFTPRAGGTFAVRLSAVRPSVRQCVLLGTFNPLRIRHRRAHFSHSLIWRPTAFCKRLSAS